MTVRSAWLLNPGQTRADTRLSPLGAMAALDALTSKGGVLPGGSPLVLTGSGMTGSVSTGRAVVQGTTAQGAYPVVLSAAEPITVANGHASLARIDSVFLAVYDQAYDTSGQTSAAAVYVQGTAASSPTAPTAVPNCTAYLKLWDIGVPAGASAGAPINWGSALTDRRVFTVAAGGIGYGADAAAGAYPGQYRDTGSGLQRWTGAAWRDGILLGADTELYRSAANVLRTTDALTVERTISVLNTDTTITPFLSQSPAGQTARLLALQVGGADRFTVDKDGNVAAAGSITSAGVGSVQNVYKWTSQNLINTTTLTTDPDLYFTVQPNSRYVFDGHLAYYGETYPSGPADLKADWTIPSGADFQWQRGGYPSNNSAQIDTVQTDHSTIRVLGTFGTGTVVTARFSGRVVTVANGGTCQLRWAQNVGCATTSSVRAGSWIRVTRLL